MKISLILAATVTIKTEKGKAIVRWPGFANGAVGSLQRFTTPFHFNKKGLYTRPILFDNLSLPVNLF